MSRYKVHVVDSNLKQPLTTYEVVEIIETGIKFFLFQRGQIPLPYDKLQSKPQSGEVDSKRIIGDRRLCLSANEEDESGNSGWERVRAMKLRRKEERKMITTARKYQRMVEKETVVRDTWDDLFKRLRSVLLSSLKFSVVGVALMFGPSVFNPTEVVQFSIDPTALKISQTKAEVQKDEYKGKIRSFYKNLIMSPAFLEFTNKQLKSSCTHICIFTSELMSNDPMWKEMIPLESCGIHFPNAPPAAEVTSFRSNKKLLHVNIQMPAPSAYITNVEEIAGSTSCPNNAATAIDLGKLYYYQMPLKYRGIRSFKL